MELQTFTKVSFDEEPNLEAVSLSKVLVNSLTVHHHGIENMFPGGFLD